MTVLFIVLGIITLVCLIYGINYLDKKSGRENRTDKPERPKYKE